MVLFVRVSLIQLFPGMSEASLGLWKGGTIEIKHFSKYFLIVLLIIFDNGLHKMCVLSFKYCLKFNFPFSHSFKSQGTDQARRYIEFLRYVDIYFFLNDIKWGNTIYQYSIDRRSQCE